MKEMLYWAVGWITKIHNYILHLNDAFEYNFTDKELHFLVVGVLGMGLVFGIYPIFRWLVQRKPCAHTHMDLCIYAYYRAHLCH